MGILDRLKHAVTGGAAKVELVKHSGSLAAGEMVYVRVQVDAAQGFDSDGVFIDLHGEDDLEENVLDKAAEIFNPDPEYSWPIQGATKFAGNETVHIEGALQMPADFATDARTWLIRARVEAIGKDPTSAWVAFGAG